MAEIVLAGVAVAWIVEALALGYLMGRRGYDATVWTAIAFVVGPIAVGVAIYYVSQRPSREPRVLRAGLAGRGAVDVLVGVDGSPEADAALARVATLFGPATGRVTLARVVPVDAEPETEQIAGQQLSAAAEAHPELDPTTVVLRGEPVATLRDYVARLGYEVLVVGTRGAGRSKTVFGGVATALARGAGIPVLLVDDARPAAEAEDNRHLREVV